MWGLQTYYAEFGEEMRVWGEGWWKVLSRVFQNKCREFVLENEIIKFSQSDKLIDFLYCGIP